MIDFIATTCGKPQAHGRHDWDGPLGEWYECPGAQEWESGVGGIQCDTCERSTICNPVYEDDPEIPTAWRCRGCWYPGDDE